MTIIDQALFGYSDGHHLLASSRTLSSKSLKVLTPLTDSSGSGRQCNLEGYLTGCYLPDDDCYALSKTWYAHEMPRPGCVWTHTLLLTLHSLENMTHSCLDKLFIRPNADNINWKKTYGIPLQISDRLAGKNDRNFAHINWKATNNFLGLISEATNPIVIFSNDHEKYNTLLEDMFCLWNISFFKEFSFCTASLSNRLINKAEITLQIVPTNISKGYFRSNGSSFIDFYDDTNIEDKNNSLDYGFEDLHKFVCSFGIKHYAYTNLKVFVNLFSFIGHRDFDIKYYSELLTTQFSLKDAAEISDSFFDYIINTRSMEKMGLSMLLQRICTFKKPQNMFTLVSEHLLEQAVQKLWLWDNLTFFTLLSELIGQELNEYGEKLIYFASMIMKPSDIEKITNQNSICIVLVQTNWRLALNHSIWLKSESFQTDIVKSFSAGYKKCADDEKALVFTVFQNIFNFSNEDIEECLYNEFENLSIEMFFDWAETLNEETLVRKWVRLCNFDPVFSINRLSHSKNPILFRTVIQRIDPYSSNIQDISAEVWMRLYSRFCRTNNDKSTRESYAKFLLPIILRGNQAFPDEVIKFAFIAVHSILQNDAMDYRSWEKLSTLLPEIAWYNSWDKCKRLRKAAKQRHYNIFH